MWKRRRVGWTEGVLFMSHWFGWRNVEGGVIDGTVTEAVAVALGWDRPTVSDSWPCQHSLLMCFFVTGVTEVNRPGVTGFSVTDVQSAVRNLSPVLDLHISLQMSRHSRDPSSDRNHGQVLIRAFSKTPWPDKCSFSVLCWRIFDLHTKFRLKNRAYETIVLLLF